MKTRDELKTEAFEEIEARKPQISDLGMSIFAEPEDGYREYKTAAKVADIYRELDIPFTEELAITGVKGMINGAAAGPTIAVIGELDAMINPGHPAADKSTGAVHACGHFAQIAAITAAGRALKKIMGQLPGRVVLFAVPAEELVNLDFRKKLREEGKIRFFGGKQELVRLGEFDDIDIAFMQHAHTDASEKYCYLQTTNAFVQKDVRFIGKASHAGGAPELGINALHAYNVALSAINAQRETFRDEDAVRVHGYVKRGGDSVNVVPAEVAAELQVRSKNMEALRDADLKVDRALRAGALGLGAGVEIGTFPGYLPLENNPGLGDIWRKNTEALYGEGTARDAGHGGIATDMGDLTQLLPGLHPFIGGFEGSLHASDFRLTDEETAFLAPAKIAVSMIIDLLFDGAASAKSIIEDFNPALTKKTYLQLLESYDSVKRWKPE